MVKCTFATTVGTQMNNQFLCRLSNNTNRRPSFTFKPHLKMPNAEIKDQANISFNE